MFHVAWNIYSGLEWQQGDQIFQQSKRVDMYSTIKAQIIYFIVGRFGFMYKYAKMQQFFQWSFPVWMLNENKLYLSLNRDVND